MSCAPAVIDFNDMTLIALGDAVYLGEATPAHELMGMCASYALSKAIGTDHVVIHVHEDSELWNEQIEAHLTNALSRRPKFEGDAVVLDVQYV